MADSDNRRATAYHEAGHVVMSYLMRKRFSKVSIIEEDDSAGRMTLPASFWQGALDYDPPRPVVERIASVLLAGPASVEILTGEDMSEETASDDIDRAADWMIGINGSAEATEAHLNWLWIRTKDALGLPWHWAAVGALADELLAHQEIGYREARQIIVGAMDSYQKRPT